MTLENQIVCGVPAQDGNVRLCKRMGYCRDCTFPKNHLNKLVVSQNTPPGESVVYDTSDKKVFSATYPTFYGREITTLTVKEGRVQVETKTVRSISSDLVKIFKAFFGK